MNCPKDIGFENTFSDSECEMRKFYGDCYHCWSSSIASHDHKKVYDVLEQITSKYIICDDYGNVYHADELFKEIYNKEALDILRKNI